MAENLHKQPKRGILKASTSFEQREQDHNASHPKNPHFDELNILATFHPPDKDYGFMKIEEPKTPFEYASENEEENLDDDGNQKSLDKPDELDANLLAAKIASDGAKGPRPRRVSEPSADEEDLQLLSPEERERRSKFEQKRKMHYNEYYAVKMARQLMDQEGNPDEEEEDNNGSSVADVGDKVTADDGVVDSDEASNLPDSVDPPEDGDASISAASNLEETPTSLTPAASPMDVTENCNV